MSPSELNPADLAPGDGKSRAFDWSGFTLARIRSVDDPLFGVAYEHLWDQFGRVGEMERVEVLRRRFAWDPTRPAGGYALLYEMVLVRTIAGAFAAARDHAAVVSCAAGPRAVVFLSHNLVDPAFRRSGLAGWMRALPVAAARKCLAAAGVAGDAPVSVTLVAEMDPLLRYGTGDRSFRLQAYEKAGFLKVDPSRVAYYQPDFRDPAKIDAAGGPAPIPMSLLMRRVGREHEEAVSGREVRAIVSALYHMYARCFRPRDMAPLLRELETYPVDDALVQLVPPTAV